MTVRGASNSDTVPSNLSSVFIGLGTAPLRKPLAHKIDAASCHQMRHQCEPRGWTFAVGKVFIEDLERQAPLTLGPLKYRGIYGTCSDLIHQRRKQIGGNNRHLVYKARSRAARMAGIEASVVI